MCVEKGSELPKGDKNRRFKGRVVLGGNDIRDQHGVAALYTEMESNPNTFEATHLADWCGALPGHVCQCADARQAYLQADFEGPDLWVRLPREVWEIFGIPDDAVDPVVKALKAIYGHPKVWQHMGNALFFYSSFL